MKITSVEIQIGKRSLKFTPEELTELRDEIDRVLPRQTAPWLIPWIQVPIYPMYPAPPAEPYKITWSGGTGDVLPPQTVTIAATN